MICKHRKIRWIVAVGLSVACQALASGRISQIRAENAKVKMTVETVSGARYQMQCSTNLTAGAWEHVGMEFVAVREASSRSAPTDAGNCYFRVVVVDESPAGNLPPPPSFSPPPPPPS
jgi:hypothetical protein